MTAAPSYATAATGELASSARRNNKLPPQGGAVGNGASSLEDQIRELSTPQPVSMTLNAALQLLEPISVQRDVFLMTRSYLQNWLVWAYHQKVSKVEAARVEAAVRLAANHLGLTPPSTEMDYSDPGPIDASMLAMEGHPLLLRPNVEVVYGKATKDEAEDRIPEELRRVKSLPVNTSKDDNDERDPAVDDLDAKDDRILCCAVTDKFYEVSFFFSFSV